MLLFTRKQRVGWGETGFRCFFLSRFLIFAAGPLFSARLYRPKALLAQATWREKRYVISAFILHFESPLPDALLPESEQVLQKQKCSGSNLIKAMKINIWRPSIKLVWRVCFICVFNSCRTNAGIFYARCKGTFLKKIFLCFRRAQGAMQ